MVLISHKAEQNEQFPGIGLHNYGFIRQFQLIVDEVNRLNQITLNFILR